MSEHTHPAVRRILDAALTALVALAAGAVLGAMLGAGF